MTFFSFSISRLFSGGPIKTTYVPKQNPSTSWGSSKDYASAESYLEKENSNNGLLFASFGKADDDVYEQEGQDRKSLAIDRGGGLIKKSQKGYKTGALKKKTSSKSSIATGRGRKKHTDRDRLFSNDTLNYVVKGIDAVEISPKPNDDDEEEQEAEQVPRPSRIKQTSTTSSSDNYCEEEVFKSLQCEGQQKFEAADTAEVKEIVATTEAAAELRPHEHEEEAAVVPRCINKASRGLTGLIAGNGTAGSDESIDVVNSSLPPPSQLFYQQQPQVITTDKTPKADATSGSNSIFPHPKSSTPYNNNLLHSPSTSINFGLGNLHASTPISHHKNPPMASSNYRDSERAKPNLFESPRSPLISNVPLPDLISRKGGKNWRRSVNVTKFSPNGGRRATIASKPATTLKVSISFSNFEIYVTKIL